MGRGLPRVLGFGFWGLACGRLGFGFVFVFVLRCRLCFAFLFFELFFVFVFDFSLFCFCVVFLFRFPFVVFVFVLRFRFCVAFLFVVLFCFRLFFCCVLVWVFERAPFGTPSLKSLESKSQGGLRAPRQSWAKSIRVLQIRRPLGAPHIRRARLE